MKQSILIEPQHSQLEERPIPQVGPNDVLIKVNACGVCASELHAWLGDEGPYPRELGHEVSGEVVETGREVEGIVPGMAVTGLFQRGFAEYTMAPYPNVTPIPEGIDYDVALGEPISCVISAVRRTRIELGDTVAIIGLGFMGLLMLQAVQMRGPARIIGIDVRDEVLEMAHCLGVDETMKPEQISDALKLTNWDQLGKRHGVDVVIEATGTQAGLALAGQMAREHGVLAILGYHQGGLRQVDMELWNWKALEVVNAHERRAAFQMDCMRRGLNLLTAGKLQVTPLVTHRFGLDQVDDAFQTLLTKPAGFVKAVIVSS